MSYQEFLNMVQKKGSKPFKISHCYGARDAWKWVRRNKWEALKGNKCSSSVYSEVINKTNKLLIERLLSGHQLILPHQMGTLLLIGTPTRIVFKDGKVVDNYRTDWKKTLECWYEDNNMRINKKRIKRIQSFLYTLKYSKLSARYKNQKYYQFSPNRSLVRTLGRKIDNEKLNVLIC